MWGQFVCSVEEPWRQQEEFHQYRRGRGIDRSKEQGHEYAHRSIVVGRSKRQSQVGRDKRVAQDEGTKKP